MNWKSVVDRLGMKHAIITLMCTAIVLNLAVSWYSIVYKADVHKGNLSVMLADQVTSPLLVDFNRTVSTAALTHDAQINDTTLALSDVTGFKSGTYVTITDHDASRYWFGHQLGEAKGSVITVDTPLDHGFKAGATVVNGTHDLTSKPGTLQDPVVYGSRSNDAEDIPVIADITRIAFSCGGPGPMGPEGFCGGPALANGIVLRKTNGSTDNIYNFKTNRELKEIMTACTTHNHTMSGNIVFAGQDNMGVAIRLGPGDDLQLIVQDDLTHLNHFTMIAQGHIVIP